MRRTVFACNRCGKDITYQDYPNKILDTSFVFVVEHMPRYKVEKPEGFYPTAKIDLCYDCYKTFCRFFAPENEEAPDED